MSLHSRSLRRLLAGTAATALLLGGLAAPAEAVDSHRSQRGTYVALGDSYASGEGLAPYDTSDGCHRSVEESYPERLTDYGPRRFDRLTSVACSGALTGSVVATQTDALDARTRTVTLTVGGNDVGFAPVLVSCLYSPVPQVQQSLPGGGCQARDAEVDAAIEHLGGPAGGSGARLPLASVIGAIAAAAPRAQILVSGYPQLFGVPDGDCRVSDTLPLFVADDDIAWIREQTAALNAAIRRGVARAKAAGAAVRYVDATRTFAGHGLCDRRTPWINGVVLAPTAVPTPTSASFHPTARGQWAYAAAFSRPGWGRR